MSLNEQHLDQIVIVFLVFREAVSHGQFYLRVAHHEHVVREGLSALDLELERRLVLLLIAELGQELGVEAGLRQVDFFVLSRKLLEKLVEGNLVHFLLFVILLEVEQKLVHVEHFVANLENDFFLRSHIFPGHFPLLQKHPCLSDIDPSLLQ